MRALLAFMAAFSVLAPPALAHAQQLRTLQTARQLTDSQPVVVDVSFGAGKFALHAAEGRLLYQMRLRYDEGTTDAVHNFDNHTLTLGLERGSARFGLSALRRSADDEASELDIGLSNIVPIDLRIKVAGTESTLELGGLRLTKLEVNCAASGATVNFGSPNRAEMETLTMQFAGAGAKIENLGNANASTVRIKGAAGGLEVDFGPNLSRDVTLKAELALGALQISLPHEVGVMVRARSRLGTFDGAKLMKVGDAWYSENWNQASRKVTIESTSFVGTLELSRTGH